MAWEDKFVEVVYEGGHTRFFERFLDAREVSSLVIISPWIRILEGEPFTLSDVIRVIENQRIPTTVIMRDPKKEEMNAEADELLRQCSFANIHYNNDLHAKVYVCRCEPFGFALLGSANLSGNATRALEIGMLIEGKGLGRQIVEELELLGKDDIPNKSGTRIGQYATKKRFN